MGQQPFSYKEKTLIFLDLNMFTLHIGPLYSPPFCWWWGGTTFLKKTLFSKMSPENYLVLATVGLVIPLGAVCLYMYLFVICIYICTFNLYM